MSIVNFQNSNGYMASPLSVRNKGYYKALSVLPYFGVSGNVLLIGDSPGGFCTALTESPNAFVHSFEHELASSYLESRYNDGLVSLGLDVTRPFTFDSSKFDFVIADCFDPTFDWRDVFQNYLTFFLSIRCPFVFKVPRKFYRIFLDVFLGSRCSASYYVPLSVNFHFSEIYVRLCHSSDVLSVSCGRNVESIIVDSMSKFYSFLLRDSGACVSDFVPSHDRSYRDFTRPCCCEHRSCSSYDSIPIVFQRLYPVGRYHSNVICGSSFRVSHVNDVKGSTLRFGSTLCTNGRFSLSRKKVRRARSVAPGSFFRKPVYLGDWGGSFCRPQARTPAQHVQLLADVLDDRASCHSCSPGRRCGLRGCSLCTPLSDFVSDHDVVAVRGLGNGVLLSRVVNLKGFDHFSLSVELFDSLTHVPLCVSAHFQPNPSRFSPSDLQPTLPFFCYKSYQYALLRVLVFVFHYDRDRYYWYDHSNDYYYGFTPPDSDLSIVCGLLLRTHSFDCSDPLHCPYSLKCRFISHLSDCDFASCSGFYRRSVDVLDVLPPVDGNLSYYVDPVLDGQPFSCPVGDASVLADDIVACGFDDFPPLDRNLSDYVDPVLDQFVPVLSCPTEDDVDLVSGCHIDACGSTAGLGFYPDGVPPLEDVFYPIPFEPGGS
jgi:hypothetical protein